MLLDYFGASPFNGAPLAVLAALFTSTLAFCPVSWHTDTILDLVPVDFSQTRVLIDQAAA